MKKNFKLSLFIIVISVPIFFAGCGKKLATVTVVDERTALEKQILGQFSTISKDVYLLASVRSVNDEGKLVKSEPVVGNKKEVISSLQRMAFNADDIKYYKSIGIIGENNKGYLEIFNDKLKMLNEKQREFLIELVKQENDDRKKIMQRVLETNINLNANDLSKVEEIYASMKRDNSEKGEIIQLPDGKWIKK